MPYMEDLSDISSTSSYSDYEEDTNDCFISQIKTITFSTPTKPRYGESPTIFFGHDDLAMSDLPTLIKQRNWEIAQARLKDHPHEASTKVTLPCFPGGNCRGLPLHLACSIRPLPPVSFVTLLISQNSRAVTYQEEQWGMLPLHFACMRFKDQNKRDVEDRTNSITKHVSVVQQLIEAYPEGVKLKESFQGKLPIHLATAAYASGPSYPEIVKNLAKVYPQSIHIKDDCGDTPLAIAQRIQQWRQYCLDEDQNYLAPKLSRDENDDDSEKKIVSTMFGQALHQTLIQRNQDTTQRRVPRCSMNTQNSKKESRDESVDGSSCDSKERQLDFQLSGRVRDKMKIIKLNNRFKNVNPFFEISYLTAEGW